MTSKSALQHIPEDTLEQYCMGRLSEPETEPVEEHLLICNHCQDALTDTEEFLYAVRAATEEVVAHPQPEAQWKQWLQGLTSLPKPAFAAAAVCALALFVIVPSRDSNSAVVELQTMRGPESAALAPANTTLDLRLSLAGLDAKESLEVRVADSAGKAITQAKVEPRQGQAVAKLAGLSPGTYWARLYSKGQLVREYALNVR